MWWRVSKINYFGISLGSLIALSIQYVHHWVSPFRRLHQECSYSFHQGDSPHHQVDTELFLLSHQLCIFLFNWWILLQKYLVFKLLEGLFPFLWWSDYLLILEHFKVLPWNFSNYTIQYPSLLQYHHLMLHDHFHLVLFQLYTQQIYHLMSDPTDVD